MDDNKTKYHNGAKSRGAVLTILQKLVTENILRHCSIDYRCGYPGMNQSQFYSPYLIEFPNGYCWALFPSNSIRTDRMNIQLWNADHIRKINKNIVKTYIVVPDEIVNNEKELKIVEQYDERLRSKNYYTPMDGVIFQKQIEQLCKDFVSSEQAKQ